MNKLHLSAKKDFPGISHSKVYLPLILVISATVVIYIITILDYPGFIADDYYIFAAVSKAPQNPVSLRIEEEFYLFARPFSYFNMWLQYHLFYTSPVLMKIYGLFFHLISLTVFYYTLLYLCKVAGINFRSWIAALFTFLVSIHTDSYERIIWISNQTELFVNLYYWLSVLSLLVYISSSKRLYIYLYVLFFCLSVLSKQTSLHLPVLILFFTLIFRHLLEEKRKTIINFSLAGLFFASVYILLNIFFYKDALEMTDVLWKKPFSAIGIFLHTFFPVYAQEIYNFFLSNKFAAFISLPILIAPVTYLLIKNPKYRKPAFYIIISAIIILFPRIVSPGGSRLNGIILCWGLVLLAVAVLKLNTNYKWLSAGLILITIIFAVSFYNKAVNASYIFKKYDQAVLDFVHASQEPGRLVITDEYGYFMQYKTHFIKHNKFGKDDSYTILPFGLSSVLLPEKDKYKSDLLDAKMNDSVIALKITNPLAYISIHTNKEIDPAIKFYDKEITPSGREGFNKVNVELPEYLANKAIWVFNGNGWEILN